MFNDDLLLYEAGKVWAGLDWEMANTYISSLTTKQDIKTTTIKSFERIIFYRKSGNLHGDSRLEQPDMADSRPWELRQDLIDVW